MSLVDYAALPPEINSGRMYLGAGSGPMLAAAAAWDALSGELSSAASSYWAVVSDLTDGPWLGPASNSMAAAASPYASWMNTIAAQAEQTAGQTQSAVAAYEAAFAATVPPPVIAANRSLLMSLVATNILGQNTPAIAATEAQYVEMWAQDAAAMYGYAAASAAAATLMPFAQPHQNTDSAGLGNQAAAASRAAGTSMQSNGVSQVVSAVPLTSQGSVSGGSSGPLQWLVDLLNSPLIQAYESLTSGTAGIQSFTASAALQGAASALIVAPIAGAAARPAVMSTIAQITGSAGSAAPQGAAAPAPAGSPPATVGASGWAGAAASAGLGRSGSVGGLSVPQSWGTAAPEIRLAARALPMAGMEGVPGTGALAATGAFGGVPAVGSVVNAPSGGEARLRPSAAAKVIPQTAGEPSPRERRWANFDGCTDGGALSEREELKVIRKEIAALAKERDVLKRSAALLIQEAVQR